MSVEPEAGRAEADALERLPVRGAGPARVRVRPPGGGWSEPADARAEAGGLTLPASLASSVPGDHEVEVDGARATVRLARLPRRPVAAGVDLRQPGPASVWLHGRAAGPRLRAVRLTEDDFGIQRRQARDLVEAPPGAGMIAVAGVFPRTSTPLGWFLWREGTALVGMPTLKPATARLDLGPALVHVVEPGLGRRDGTLELFVVLAGPPRLARVRFDPPSAPAWDPPAPRVVASEPLDLPVGAARATIGDAGGARRWVVLAGDGPDGVRARRLALDGEAGAWSEVVIGGAGTRLAPGADGDLLAGAGDDLDALLPVVGPDGALGLGRAWWRGGRAREEVLPTGAPGAAASVVVRYGLRAPREHFPVRVAWAALGRDGALRSSASREPAPPGGPPATPLELVPLARTWLVTDPSAPGPGLARP